MGSLVPSDSIHPNLQFLFASPRVPIVARQCSSLVPRTHRIRAKAGYLDMGFSLLLLAAAVASTKSNKRHLVAPRRDQPERPNKAV